MLRGLQLQPRHKHCTSPFQHHTTRSTHCLLNYNPNKKAKQHTVKMGVSIPPCLLTAHFTALSLSAACLMLPHLSPSIMSFSRHQSKNGRRGDGAEWLLWNWNLHGRTQIHDHSLTRCAARTENGCCQRGRRWRRRRSTSGTLRGPSFRSNRPFQALGSFAL